MDITIHQTFLPHDDPDASLTFYRDTLGFEVRNDVGYDGMRWITVGPADQPAVSIVLEPPASDPGVTDDERRTITEMMAKGTYAGISLAARLRRIGARDVAIVTPDRPHRYRPMLNYVAGGQASMSELTREAADVAPDGATGLHEISVSVS